MLLEDGDIALCTEVQERPGPGLKWLAECDDLPSALRRLSTDRPVDALVAARVAQALQAGRVYLLSRLDAERVESLGLAPVTAPSEIARLASRAKSCIVLGSAQFAAPATMERAPERRKNPLAKRKDA
jgi:hypothetical protein